MKIMSSVFPIFVFYIFPNLTYGAENTKNNQHLQSFLIQTQNNLALLNARTLENQAALLKRVEELTQKCATLTQIIERQEQALQTLQNDQKDLLDVLNTFYKSEVVSSFEQNQQYKPDRTTTPSVLDVKKRLDTLFPQLQERSEVLISESQKASELAQKALNTSIDETTYQKVKETQDDFHKKSIELRKNKEPQ